MSYRIQARDMFWFALFHVGAILAVALFSGCAGGPLSNFGTRDKAELMSERKTRLQYELGQARMHEQSEEYDKARSLYERLVLQFPDQSEAYYRLAVARDREKQHSDAQRLYQRALELDPSNAEYMNSLGYSYFLSGNLTEAKQIQEQAVNREPGNKLYRNNLGMTLGHMQLYQPALDQFVAASGEDDAYYNLAFIYSTQQQYDQAKECFRRALEVNPRHEASRLGLESFERFEKNPDAISDEMLASESRGGYWQSYKEGGGDSEVAQAGHTEAFGGQTGAAEFSDASLSERGAAERQQLQARASALLQRKAMSGVRENSATRAGQSTEGFNQGMH